jgi:hypothetical protein
MEGSRTPEQLGKETGEALGFAIANGLEPILMRLADAVATVQAEQAEIRDEIVELTDRVKRGERDILGLRTRPPEHDRS